MFAPDKEK